MSKQIISVFCFGTTPLFYLSYFSGQIGISFLMLCSSEINVSVAVTPGISCILLFSKSIRCSLSRAYTLVSMVYGPVVKMTFHDFGNLLHLGNNSLVHGAFFQFDSYISTSPVAQRLRVYMVAGADNNAQINQALYALVNGGT